MGSVGLIVWQLCNHVYKTSKHLLLENDCSDRCQTRYASRRILNLTSLRSAWDSVENCGKKMWVEKSPRDHRLSIDENCHSYESRRIANWWREQALTASRNWSSSINKHRSYEATTVSHTKHCYTYALNTDLNPRPGQISTEFLYARSMPRSRLYLNTCEGTNMPTSIHVIQFRGCQKKGNQQADVIHRPAIACTWQTQTKYNRPRIASWEIFKKFDIASPPMSICIYTLCPDRGHNCQPKFPPQSRSCVFPSIQIDFYQPKINTFPNTSTKR